jgi:hypothetical protein
MDLIMTVMVRSMNDSMEQHVKLERSVVALPARRDVSWGASTAKLPPKRSLNSVTL